jgi:hypothetical protein
MLLSTRIIVSNRTWWCHERHPTPRAMRKKVTERVAQAIHRVAFKSEACGNACDHTEEARAAIRAYRAALSSSRSGARRARRSR